MYTMKHHYPAVKGQYDLCRRDLFTKNANTHRKDNGQIAPWEYTTIGHVRSDVEDSFDKTQLGPWWIIE